MPRLSIVSFRLSCPLFIFPAELYSPPTRPAAACTPGWTPHPLITTPSKLICSWVVYQRSILWSCGRCDWSSALVDGTCFQIVVSLIQHVCIQTCSTDRLQSSWAGMISLRRRKCPQTGRFASGGWFAIYEASLHSSLAWWLAAFGCVAAMWFCTWFMMGSGKFFCVRNASCTSAYGLSKNECERKRMWTANANLK